MNDGFKTLVDRRLSSLNWKGGDQVMNRIHRTESENQKARMRRLKPALLLCLALILASATALAIGLTFSDRYSVTRQAREVLGQKYGLTPVMLDLFSMHVEEDGADWTVRFDEAAINEKAIGAYTVVKAGGASPAASWTYDDAAPAVYADGSLASSVWGAKQLETALRLRKAYDEQSAARLEDWGDLTLEERAAFDTAPGEDITNALSIVNIAPTAEDIQEEEAIELARRAVCEKFGFSPEAIALYEPNVSFYLRTQEGVRAYRIELTCNTEGVYKDAFQIRLLSPSGEIEGCSWFVNPDKSTLPDGDLTGCGEAVKAYVEEGAFARLSAQDKSDIARRVEEAGLSHLLPESNYAAPQEGGISADDAVKAADAALTRDYGFTPGVFTFFERDLSLIEQDGTRTYKCVYEPTRGRIAPDLLHDYISMMGTYTVLLPADAGEAPKTSWSFDGQLDDAAYTRETWGAAPVYSGRMLAWLCELQDAAEAIFSKYPAEERDVLFLSIEDAAAHDQLYRDAGFDPLMYNSMLPQPGDLTQEAALALARQALGDERGLTDAWLDECELLPSFGLFRPDGEKRVWSFTFFHPSDSESAAVVLSAEDGEIQGVYYYPSGYANG